MKTNIVIDISPLVPYPAKFWFLSYGSKCCWSIKLQDSCEKTSKVPCKLIVSRWVCIARHALSTQNRFLHIFAISPEKREDEVNFSPADKPQRFPQIDVIT